MNICPCGNRIEKKPRQSLASAEKQKYCSVKCKGKYHKPEPAAQGFGIEAPKDKSVRRLGPGVNAYFSTYKRPA